MKIGIITLWQSSDNYGQQLQCWALQQVLIELGHEPYLIRYDIDNRSSKPKSPLWKKILKLILVYPIIKYLKGRKRKKKELEYRKYNSLKNKERKFESFRKEHLSLSEYVYTNLQELKVNPPMAEAYIVGSDQVWAHLLSQYENRAMFLDFGKQECRRIAYAPSFSMPFYPAKLKSELRDNLKRFNSLSVREQTGVRICNEVGCDARVVVDPTLLLKSEEYSNLISRKDKSSYIYLYYLNITDSEEVKWNALKSYAAENKINIIATPATGYIQGRELFDNATYDYATIPRWLSLISNAKLVVTTSFHGVVFCLLYHTPFVYFPLKGKFSRGNNRVYDLCKSLNLCNRIWSKNSSFHNLCSNQINWCYIDKIIDLKRKESINYLIRSLS